MHDTINWYQCLLFGSPVGAEDPHESVQVGSLSLGLDALLVAMDLGDSEVSLPSDFSAGIMTQGGTKHCVNAENLP